MDEKGLQVFVLLALSIYGQLFPTQNPKSALWRKSEQLHSFQTTFLDREHCKNRIWPVLSFLFYRHHGFFSFLEDLSVDTKQMTVDNLFDVVNKSKVTAKPANTRKK